MSFLNCAKKIKNPCKKNNAVGVTGDPEPSGEVPRQVITAQPTSPRVSSPARQDSASGAEASGEESRDAMQPESQDNGSHSGTPSESHEPRPSAPTPNSSQKQSTSKLPRRDGSTSSNQSADSVATILVAKPKMPSLARENPSRDSDSTSAQSSDANSETPKVLRKTEGYNSPHPHPGRRVPGRATTYSSEDSNPDSAVRAAVGASSKKEEEQLPPEAPREASSPKESSSPNRMADTLPQETKTIKKDVEESKVSPQEPTKSQESKASDEGVDEEDCKAPKKEELKETSPKPKASRESSHEPQGSRESSHEPRGSRESSHEPQESDGDAEKRIPRGVTPLDDVEKLIEIIKNTKFDVKHPFYEKISLFYGDITKLQVDAIVNAANAPLSGGGGVDGAIHNAAGHRELQIECKKHDRPVATGNAVITTACKLSTHVKNIIHCVGPICYGGVTNEKRKQLESCYRRAIQISEENGLRSIAFCCISTGIYGYDNYDAAQVVIKFLWKYFSKKENVEKWDRVVLCLFLEIDQKCYKNLILKLLKDPTLLDDEEEEVVESEDDDENKDKKKKKDEKDDKKEKKEDDDDKKEKKEDEPEEKDKKGKKKEETPKKDDKMGEEAAEEENVDDTEAPIEKKWEGGDAEEEEAPATTSPSNTSAVEKADGEEQNGGKEDGEKENNEVDSNLKNEDGEINQKRALSEAKEGQPPIKRDKIERESSV